MEAAIELQRRLPNARVLYVSATGATEASNLGYTQRLGLWGPGTSFRSKDEFISCRSKASVSSVPPTHCPATRCPFGASSSEASCAHIERGEQARPLGAGVMELVAMELKQSGYFLARTLSYEVHSSNINGTPHSSGGLILFHMLSCAAS